MLVPIRRRDAAFLPIRPARVGFQCSRKTCSVERSVVFAKCCKRACQIDGDNDSADVENNRSGRFEDWAAKNRHGYSRSEELREQRERFLQVPANLARNTLMIGREQRQQK